MTKTNKNKTIPWKYCECGCHGYEFSILEKYFWLYWDLKETFYLSERHSFCESALKFKSWNDVNYYVCNELKRLKKQISKLDKFLQD